MSPLTNPLSHHRLCLRTNYTLSVWVAMAENTWKAGFSRYHQWSVSTPRHTLSQWFDFRETNKFKRVIGFLWNRHRHSLGLWPFLAIEFPRHWFFQLKRKISTFVVDVPSKRVVFQSGLKKSYYDGLTDTQKTEAVETLNIVNIRILYTLYELLAHLFPPLPVGFSAKSSLKVGARAKEGDHYIRPHIPPFLNILQPIWHGPLPSWNYRYISYPHYLPLLNKITSLTTNWHPPNIWW